MRVFKIAMLSICLSVVFIMMMASCKTRGVKNNSRASSEFAANDSDSVFVSLDRFPCFGMCPTYNFQLFNSGYALYKGKMEVARLGTYEARFTKEQMRMFIDAATEWRVDTLQGEYVNPQIADFPATWSSIVLKGKRHTFHVSTDTPPESVVGFEKSVERLLEIAEWKKISDKAE